MDQSIVIAPPDSRSLRQALRLVEGQKFSWAYIGQRPDDFRLATQQFPVVGDHLDTARRFHEAGEDLRDAYLAYVYELGRNLSDIRWWLTSLAYRNGYVSKTFHRTCFLKVALDYVRNWEGTESLVLVVADGPVRHALMRNLEPYEQRKIRVIGRYRPLLLGPVRDLILTVIRRTFFLFREGRRLFQSRRIIGRPHLPPESTTLLISTIHSGNMNRGGDFHTYAFGDLAARLTAIGCRVAIVPMVLRDVNYNAALNQATTSSVPLVVPHRYLKYFDLLWAAIVTLGKPPIPRAAATFSGMDIGPLVKDDLRQHYVSNRAADSFLVVALLRRLANLGASIARIIYIYENQPWERALCWETRRSLPETVLIGYQHARIPRFILNWYLASGGESEAPLPDYWVTVGKHTAQLLSSDGYDSNRIRVGGALQVQNLFKNNLDHGNSQASGDIPVVLIAPTAGQEEAAEVVDMARQLFDPEEGIRVVVKCHPSMPYERFKGLMGGELPANMEVSEEPINDLMSKSSLMVYTGSTVCVQALALGLPVVFLRPQFDFSMDPLEAVPELRLEAIGAKELEEKVRWLLGHRETYIEEHKDAWDIFVKEMYGPVDDECVRAFVI